MTMMAIAATNSLLAIAPMPESSMLVPISDRPTLDQTVIPQQCCLKFRLGSPRPDWRWELQFCILDGSCKFCIQRGYRSKIIFFVPQLTRTGANLLFSKICVLPIH